MGRASPFDTPREVYVDDTFIKTMEEGNHCVDLFEIFN